MNVGLLKGVDLSVDSTQIRTDASPHRAITREQLPEIAKVNRTVREYVEQVERENVVAEPEQTSDPSSSEAEDQPELRRTYRNSPPMKISTTDPEAALSSKRGASEFAYCDSYLIDNRSCIIAGVLATPACLSQEIIAARQMLERAKERSGLQRVSVTADKSYGTGEFLSWLSHRQMTPYILVLDRKQQTRASTRSMILLIPRPKRISLSSRQPASPHRVESRFTGLYNRNQDQLSFSGIHKDQP